MSLRFAGSDGLVTYLEERLRGVDDDAYIRVVDPTRENYEAHLAEMMAAPLRDGAVAISIIAHHGDRPLARYKRAAKAAQFRHGVARSVAITVGEIRDPAATGMNPIDHDLHARLFPGLDPEVLVLAVEVALAHDDRVISAGELEPWLRAGAGTRGTPVVSTELSWDLTAAALVGDLVRSSARPMDYEHALHRDDDLAGAVALWAADLNAALDSRPEPRRIALLGRRRVGFLTAHDWVLST